MGDVHYTNEQALPADFRVFVLPDLVGERYLSPWISNTFRETAPEIANFSHLGRDLSAWTICLFLNTGSAFVGRRRRDEWKTHSANGCRCDSHAGGNCFVRVLHSDHVHLVQVLHIVQARPCGVRVVKTLGSGQYRER